MVDDDTFVFHHNLVSNLALMDASAPIYTGDVIPDSWLPVGRDGSGNVSSAPATLAPCVEESATPLLHSAPPRGRNSACRQTRSLSTVEAALCSAVQPLNR